VEAWFEGARDAGGIKRLLAHRFPDSPIDLRSEEFEPDRWIQDYRLTFRGFAIDDRFYVYPPWEEPSPLHPVNLLIEPGHGFGTGTHESTQLALQCLADCIVGAGSFLDVGTGSGILTMGALKLQPGLTAFAIDIDPLAVEAAAEGLFRNHLRAELVVGGPECIGGQFEVVAANLTAPLICGCAADLVRLSGRRLVVSGFTQDEEFLVSEALSGLGVVSVGRRSLNGWCAQVYRK
jgi:ribosomal protein L11 methyltransferase